MPPAKPPKILVFAKEFNPGDPASDFIAGFAGEMRKKEISIDLVTFAPEYSKETQLDGFLNVFRVPFMLHGDSYFNWLLLMNGELKKKGRELAEDVDYLLVLASDWTGYPAASAISTLFNIPLVTVFQSTENNRGFSSENSRPISDIEWEAGYTSRRVVAMNENCRNSLIYDLKIPAEKIISTEGLFSFISLLEEVVIHRK
ncbi:MAG: hypothetical protein V1820_05590 [archaeon]